MENRDKTKKLNEFFNECNAVVVGTVSGLSISAGFLYACEKFQNLFSDFIHKYQFSDLFSASFFNFKDENEKWAFWSRFIYHYRFAKAEKPMYSNLYKIIKNKDYFVITTNVDHLFQCNGVDKQRLFCTQGDYGLLQCSVPCHQKTYDNKDMVLQMVEKQKKHACTR